MMAKQLIASGLSHSVKKIVFCISDINPLEDEEDYTHNPLIDFAEKLQNSLNTSWKKNITIDALGDPLRNHITTLLVPPKTCNEEWEIYGFTKESLEKIKDYSLDALKNFSEKKLLWKGVDLQKIFEKQAKSALYETTSSRQTLKLI